MRRVSPYPRALAGALAVAVISGTVAAVVLLDPAPAECDDPALCQPQQTRLDAHGYLRAVSLDVRGVVPTPEEHAALGDGDALPDDVLDAWLSSEDFEQRVVRRHRDLLWPNIENVTSIYHFRRNLSRISAGSLWQQANQSTRLVYRGANVSCLDEPATFDADGNVVTRIVDGAEVEGYVWVRPYWDPSTELKVCAFDAQERAVSPVGNDCSTRAAVGDRGCGCGPNLRWCGTGVAQRAVLEAFADELEHRIVQHLRADEPYHALLTSRRGYVNGPLTHYWRHHRESYNNVQLVPEAIDVESLPETALDADGGVAFASAEWTAMELPEEHAGLLTHPVFLLRFQTNRARASRFYDAFLCDPFQPPPGGIPVEDEVASLQPDVQQRPGCAYCHAILEPAAAHWGRWTQQGGGYLPADHFPEFLQECADCGRRFEACSDLCRFNYVTQAIAPEEEVNLGRLRAYEFLRPAHRPFVDAGPTALVREGLADGRFTRCTVRRTTSWLLGREVRAEEETWVRELTQRFVSTDFRYRELVRAIVESETYRRAL